MKFTLKIWRQKNAKAKGRFETYQVDGVSPDTSTNAAVCRIPQA